MERFICNITEPIYGAWSKCTHFPHLLNYLAQVTLDWIKGLCMSRQLLSHLICNIFRRCQPSLLHASSIHFTLKFTYGSIHTLLTVGWSLVFIFKSLQFIVQAEREYSCTCMTSCECHLYCWQALWASLSLTECRWAQPLGLWPTAWPFGWGEINQAINCLQRAIIHPASRLARASHLQHLFSHLHDVAM